MKPTVQEQLDLLLDQILQDEGLDKELKDNLTDLIAATSSDPTPENIDALALVFSKLGDANKYMEAMTAIQNISLKNDYEKLAADGQVTESPESTPSE